MGQTHQVQPEVISPGGPEETGKKEEKGVPEGSGTSFFSFLDKYPMGVYYSLQIPPWGINETEETRMSEEKTCPNCGGRKKMRTPEEKKDLLKRLRLAEGQIRGIQNMVENDAYCPDILVQVSAVTAALNSFNRELLACHIRSCVAEDIRSGDGEAIDAFVGMLQKLMK